jgi:glyoxylase-like metal-dependent hydrolase (beta-lactamase superfamily II)
MRTATYSLYGLTLAASLTFGAAQAASLKEAADALGAANTKTIEFSGTGRWFQFGQAPNPTLPWPHFDVSSYDASIDYDAPSAHVQIVRKQAIEPGRQRPVPVEQKPDQYVSGAKAWNIAPPPNTPPGTAPAPVPQPAAVEERLAEIWATPQGFLKAALANDAKTEAKGGDLDVSFTTGGKYRYEGVINAKNQVERVRTLIDNPVLGDTPVETVFSDYRDFGGVQFPGHIVRVQGGYPVLDLNVAAVKLNPPVSISVPDAVASAQPAAPKVTVTKLADGVFYLLGGTHHSVAIEQKDHVVLVEAPLNEDRSIALIDKIKVIIPGKPIKYVVNSHAHFDHAGGLRTFVDAGAIIVSPEADKPYFEKAWAAPRTLNPDRLAKSQRTAKFETYADKYTLTDGSRAIEIRNIAGNGHSDDLALVYLPAEKVLIEADAYTPPFASSPPAAAPNPYTVNLYDNIVRLKLDVDQIAALHGPGVVHLADLKAAIGQATTQ